MKPISTRVLALAIGILMILVLTAAAAEVNWLQWAQNQEHQGFADVVGQSLDGQLAEITYDPLVPDEQAANGGDLLAHYQVPLIDNEDVFMEAKTGSFDGSTFNTEVWHQKRHHWEGGQLVQKWDFTTDWKPEPIDYVGGWEPVYHAVVVGGFVYDMGAGGTLFKLNRGDGSVITRINPFGSVIAPNTFTAGPPSADRDGNIYYNVLRIDPATLATTGSWLVKVDPNDGIRKVPYTTLVSGAPTSCVGVFSRALLPWPKGTIPSDTTSPADPNAVPSSSDCGPQRPGVNVAPAIAPDGTIYTVSRADNNGRYAYVVAVNPDLTPKWAASMRDRLNDGCGVTIPIATSSNPVQKGKCRWGATVGVDPQTNQKPAGRVIDQSSSSPTVLPDGSVLYGSYSRYNVSRGHLFKFSSTGVFLAAYDFGWDSTPAVLVHDGTYSIVIKDNHYDEEEGFYCNRTSAIPVSLTVCAFTGVPAGPFYITQLSPNLIPEWKFHSIETESCTRNPDGTRTCVSDHPNGFEWCINAPAIDRNGFVYVNSEDGNLYKLPQGFTGVFDMNATGVTRLFLNLAIGAAYTPLSLGPDGKIYTENDGKLFVVGTGGRSIGQRGGHGGVSGRNSRLPEDKP